MGHQLDRLKSSSAAPIAQLKSGGQCARLAAWDRAERRGYEVSTSGGDPITVKRGRRAGGIEEEEKRRRPPAKLGFNRGVRLGRIRSRPRSGPSKLTGALSGRGSDRAAKALRCPRRAPAVSPQPEKATAPAPLSSSSSPPRRAMRLWLRAGLTERGRLCSHFRSGCRGRG